VATVSADAGTARSSAASVSRTTGRTLLRGPDPVVVRFSGQTRRDRFRVRERYRPLLLSYLVPELRRIVCWRPRPSAAVCGDRYSVGYSVARLRSDHLDANYRRVQPPRWGRSSRPPRTSSITSGRSAISATDPNRPLARSAPSQADATSPEVAEEYLSGAGTRADFIIDLSQAPPGSWRSARPTAILVFPAGSQ
jgi:hypothetical protein